MKKIIWLASYPKCGNTYLRLFLSHYICNEENSLDFGLLSNIQKFEAKQTFEKVLDLNLLKNKFVYYKYCIDVQNKLINSTSKEYLIFKTHHFFGQFNGFDFTNENNTLFFIYLVRDPREVLVSYAKHSGITIDEMLKFFINDKAINREDFETKLNWKQNYKSWKSFKSVPSLFIKYEDLISSPFEVFSSVVFMFSRYTKIQYNEEKIKKIIKFLKFQNLQKEEKKVGFNESIGNKFFRSGKKDSWKKILNRKQIIIIEKNFSIEMKELKYI